MKNRISIILRKAYGSQKTILKGIKACVFADYSVRLGLKYRLYKCRKILKMIIKGVAVYAAVFNDIFYCNMADRFIVQQFKK